MTKTTGRLAVLIGLGALLAATPAAKAAVPPIGMVCSAGGPAFDLVADEGDIATPDGNSVFMWGFTTAGGEFQTPGPVLCANEGDTVTIHLHNGLDSHAAAPAMVPENVSMVFPGQEGVTASGGSAGVFTREAAPGGDVTYSFTAGRPGTYHYESGTDPSKQLEMGLYGALVVRPSGHPDQAYGDASTRFAAGREFLIMLNELDPDLHHAVETGATYDFTTLHNRYFNVNGREFPDTVQDNGVSWLPNQPYGSLIRVQPYCDPSNPSDPLNPPGCTSTSPANRLPALIRMIDVGELNHPFHPHGNHLRQIAQDGRPFAGDASSEHFGETIGAGQSQDYLLTWADQDFWDATTRQFPDGAAAIDYHNLTFKDGNTFFSGSAYLGRKGTLPTGTVAQNVCGEWYFPWHSHALNEFANFDEGFGGMATLLRVDPRGGCYAFPGSTAILGGVLKSGAVGDLAVDDGTYYQVNPKTTTRPTATTAAQTSITVASASGFPAAGTYYVRIDNEVVQVTGGQGTTTWTVQRGQLGTAAAAHAAGAVITALADDWYAGFSGLPAGAQNLKVSFRGRNCASTTGTACAALTTNLPQQTIRVCNWTIAGAAGCSTATSSGWVTLPPPPAQPRGVGSTEDPPATWMLPGSANAYIGTGSYKGQVRMLVHTQRWTAPNPAPFSTWGNVMQLVYDAP
ncbi:multicopper oxidase domain-containing protein [Candidatus Solirubrobacter pratensis]|uniref:multicopper oxidase domain-containing protein n=1 Tax=Candidatus Solirubrobacter pratensis TaxID=1298857 RepID=UPI0018CA3325|nr:multicopper oxidase domain-containing protein [Candidatus Solirubrobacter pratensis]